MGIAALYPSYGLIRLNREAAADLVELSGRGTGEEAAGLPDGHKLGRLDGARKVITLGLLAADLGQELDLRRLFRPLGDDDEAECVGKVVDRADDRAHLGRGRQLGYEDAVDLQFAERQPMELDDGGVAGAEIVDRQARPL